MYKRSANARLRQIFMSEKCEGFRGLRACAIVCHLFDSGFDSCSRGTFFFAFFFPSVFSPLISNSFRRTLRVTTEHIFITLALPTVLQTPMSKRTGGRG